MNLSGPEIAPWPGFKELIEPDCGCDAGVDEAGVPSLGGSGLFRGSFKAVVEEEGVATGDCAASLEEPAGDDVPSLESLLLDLEDLFGSLARESCSC